MQITTREQDGIVILTLEGRVDNAGAGEMDRALQSSADTGQHRMVLDMAGITYLNSAGLRTVADILTRSRANGGDLHLVALSPKVERVFKIIGFDRFFDIYDTVEAALRDFE